MSKKNALKTKFSQDIFVMFSLSILVPVVIISMLFSAYYSNQTIKYNHQQINSVLSSTSKSIELYLDQLERISFSPYLYKDVLNTMILMKNGFMESAPDHINIAQYADNYSMLFIKMLYSSNQSIRGITFYPMPPNNELVYEINRSSSEIQTLKRPGYSQEDWFNALLKKNGEITYSSFYNDNQTNKQILFAARIIKDFDSKKNIGVLKIDTSFDIVKSIIDGVSLSEHSKILLINENNDLVYSTTSTLDKQLLVATCNQMKTVKVKGDTYFLSRYNSPKSGWTLVYLSSKNDIILKNVNAFILVFFIGCISVLISLGIYRIRSKKMISSVNSIIHTIHKIQKGDLSSKCYVDDQNELAMIADALNKMGDKLSKHIDKEYKAIINQRNAEYIALQSQINPHFLYNTLNGFIALNRMGERDLLEKNIIQLTRLFRYTCKNSNISTIKEEFDFVTQYLELQKLRFEERFEYVIELDSDAENIVIPKLLVQPIVENCIIHGMEPSFDPVLIQISAKMINHFDLGLCVEINITDNGVGFEQNDVSGDSSHVGLLNITERVSYFNTSSIFKIESSVGKGTKCNIIIPRNK